MKIKVVVHPNSKNPRIEKDLLDITHVYVREPPLEGKANKAVAIALAERFHVPVSHIELLSGTTSKVKLFYIPQIDTTL